MKLKVTYLSVLYTLIFLACVPKIGVAQPDLGIIWQAPDDAAEAEAQLSVFAEHGISHIEFPAATPQSVFDRLGRFDFNISVRNPISYLTTSDVNARKNELLKKYRTFIQHYDSIEVVSSLGIFSNSQTDHPDFYDAFQPIFDSLSVSSDKPLYFHSGVFWHDVEQPNTSFGITFFDETFSLSDIEEFDSVFKQSISDEAGTVLFMHDQWFLDAVAEYPPFSESIQSYATTSSWLLPLPDVNIETNHRPWMVFLLLVIWIALVVEIKYLPYLRSTIMRYFFAHRFFVDDILHYRERAARGSYLMLIKHAVLVGMVSYMFFKTGLSETGLAAFFYHFPFLAILGKSYISLLILGSLAAVLVQSVALFWLHFPSKKTEYFGQTVNIYAGALYLNLIAVTVLTTLYVAHASPITLYICSAVFVLIWYNAFHIAAYDISGKGQKSRIIYLLLTLGLHVLLSVGGVIFILSQDKWLDALRLSFSL